jgi:hypothetical protein
MENYTDQDYGYGFGPYTDYGYVREKNPYKYGVRKNPYQPKIIRIRTNGSVKIRIRILSVSDL